MSKRRFALIVCFILCLFSCCGVQSKIELPSALASQCQTHNIKVYVDSEFDTSEEIAINTALNVWRNVSNDFIRFDIIWEHTKPGRLENYFWVKQFNHSVFIWKADSTSTSVEFDNKYASYAGFWDLHGNVVIFADRIDKENNQLYNVIVHEIGHMLGLKHIEYEKSVMQPKAIDISDCITKDDAYRLCLIYGCDPQPECD